MINDDLFRDVKSLIAKGVKEKQMYRILEALGYKNQDIKTAIDGAKERDVPMKKIIQTAEKEEKEDVDEAKHHFEEIGGTPKEKEKYIHKIAHKPSLFSRIFGRLSPQDKIAARAYDIMEEESRLTKEKHKIREEVSKIVKDAKNIESKGEFGQTKKVSDKKEAAMSEALPPEVKVLLKKLGSLLIKLPKEDLEEFAKSGEFETFKNVMKRL